MLTTPHAPLPIHIKLVGPTAAGKTAAALAIAHEFDCEIVSVDSALVFQGMDIGTAKPTPNELAQIPHHLINIRDPLKAYSAAEFVHDATALLYDIHARGKLPLLVGGTMLYFKALAEGIDPMPSADPLIRAEIEEQARVMGWPALHADLTRIDPVTASRLAPADSQRIQRALEVYRISGKPLSEWHAVPKPSHCENHASILISLEPRDRSWLHQRIAQRFETMLEQGLIAEVQTLRQRGDLHPNLPSMRCVGYRQVWEMLDGTLPQAELRERGIYATRQLAKRQITWLRNMPQRNIVDCEQPDALSQTLQLVRNFISRSI
jgi:tRNA dimethylallyltransferase